MLFSTTLPGLSSREAFGAFLAKQNFVVLCQQVNFNFLLLLALLDLPWPLPPSPKLLAKLLFELLFLGFLINVDFLLYQDLHFIFSDFFCF
jgi:hypothetical protein